MKCSYGSILAVAVMSAATSVSAAVSVTNADFESPVAPDNTDRQNPTGWMNTVAGANWVIARANQFGGVVGGNMPAPASGRQACAVTGGIAYQSVGTLESNRLYTLTVAVGLRSTWSAGTSKITLSAGPAFSSRTTLATLTKADPAAGTFTDVTLKFHTYGGTQTALAGQPLYIELSHTGGSNGQGTFDNIRLTETTTPFEPFANNADFEEPVAAAGGAIQYPTGWTNSIGNASYVIAMANEFGGTAGGPMPAPASGRQALCTTAYGAIAYQSVGLLESNSLYTLTVAVGRRWGHATGLASVALSAGSAFSNRTTLVSNQSPQPPQGVFTNVTVKFHTYGNFAALAGQPLYVELGINGGSGYGVFDNVQMTRTQASFEPFVNNPGFESPVAADGSYVSAADGWVTSGGGVIAMADKFGGTGGGPLPAPAEGRQSSYLPNGSYHYQNIGVVASNRIYALTVAVGTRSDQPFGTYRVWFKTNTWNASTDLAYLTGTTPAPGTFTNQTIGFNTLNGTNADAVGKSLWIVLGYSGSGQGVFDNARLSVKRPPSVSLGASPSYTNLATDSVLTVTNPSVSETDNLTTNAATGSVVLSQAVSAPTYVMLWLTGGDATKYSTLAAEITAGGATVLTVADYEWSRLGERYSGFNMLIKFPGQSDTAFNWDFGFGYSWDGTVVDRVAVSTKPAGGTMIRIF